MKTWAPLRRVAAWLALAAGMSVAHGAQLHFQITFDQTYWYGPSQPPSFEGTTGTFSVDAALIPPTGTGFAPALAFEGPFFGYSQGNSDTYYFIDDSGELAWTTETTAHNTADIGFVDGAARTIYYRETHQLRFDPEFGELLPFPPAGTAVILEGDTWQWAENRSGSGGTFAITRQIPEPGTWALMLGGLALLSFAVRPAKRH